MRALSTRRPPRSDGEREGPSFPSRVRAPILPRMRGLACHGLALAFLVQALVGIAVVFGYESALFEWHRSGLAEALYGRPSLPADALPIMRQLAAMLGGTMAAWGVAMAWVAHVPLRRGERWAAVAIVTSLLAWFPFDTGMSVVHEAWTNVGFNLAATAMIAVPLLVVLKLPVPASEAAA